MKKLFDITCVCLTLLLGISFGYAQRVTPANTPGADSLKVPYHFKDFPFLNLPKTYAPVSLTSPDNIQREVVYDTETQRYIIREKLGTKMYRPPIYMSLEEYKDYEFKRLKKNYWEELADKSMMEERKRRLIPVIEVNSPTFQKIFGGNTIEIIPRGSASILLSGQRNTNANPMFNEIQRKQWGFDFDQNIDLNLSGKIGERVKLNANFNSRAQFDFENQIRFDYVAKDDAILRRLEVGNVNMSLNSTLISGSESLFGVKAQLQFGKLMFTGLVSQQRSRQKEFTITNGSKDSEIDITLDNYEANQHYFLGQYFRDNYNNTLANAPILNTQINITQIEVWLSNRGNNYEEARDIMALMDLGEYTPYNSLITRGSARNPSTGIPGELTPNVSNNLKTLLGDNGRPSNSTFVQSFFAATGGTDNYEKLTYARKLIAGKDYFLNSKLGYISLLHPLNQDQVLSVAYRYILNGVEYQVGEFSTDIPVTPSNPTILYTKLLKASTLKTELPTWDLMMKNIYSLNSYNISNNNFFLQIYRTEDETGANRPSMFEGQNTAGKTWLQLLSLDRLDQNQAANPDGLFDYMEGLTIDAKRGKIIFPVVEPFGKDLAARFESFETTLKEKYTFPELYTHTKVDAQQKFPNKNRFSLRGRYSSTSGTEFQLEGFNIRPNSVRVMAGGMRLEEGKDFYINYELGTLRIMNEAMVMSGAPITVSMEDDAMFGLQQKTLLGGRFDYAVNEKINVGATIMNLTEKPLTEKVNIGQEPMSNTMIGADISYNSPSRWLTRMVDKLPFLSTKEESQISFYGEFAQLIPGHPSGLNTANSKRGTTYVDDFENSVSYIDILGRNAWQISGTPRMFAESNLLNDLSYGYNRALLAYYNIDPIFYNRSSLTPSTINNQELSNHRVREVLEKEIFPYKESRTGGAIFINTLNLAFYPTLRGPYNYSTTGINSDGHFTSPKTKWGGIFRKLDQTDFEAENIEFLEMWMMDPTLTNTNKAGGDIFFNLGNISEDILKDGRKSLENAVPLTADLSQIDQTNWGYVVKNQPVVQAFDNNNANRLKQDVGLDGLSNREEASFFGNFLSQLQGILSPAAMNKVQSDPSSDDYQYFRASIFDTQAAGILERYQYYNGLEGNSRTNEQSLIDFGVETSANTLLPDGEDLNRDNTMNEIDEYYQYRFSTRPQDMIVGTNHIVDEVISEVTLANGNKEQVKWYKIRIPLADYDSKFGNVTDFKTIRYVRMFMTNFADTAVVRLGKLQFIRGEWRKYNGENVANKVISDPTLGVVPSDNSEFNVANINIEENGTRSPIPYVVPPGINRQVDWGNNNYNVQLNEQALSIDVKNLRDGYGRGAYRTTSHDFRPYGNLEMFIHAEGENLRDGDFRAFIRVGTDDKYNYYEYDLPLRITPFGTTSADIIWPEENRMLIKIKKLQDAKIARDAAVLNGSPWPIDIPFEYFDGNNKITIVGTPDISKVRYYMLGVKNPLKGSSTSTPLDDGRDLSGEFWFNELRLTDFDDRGGWAATARMDVKLADFANISFTGTKSTIGFGAISQPLNQRKRSDDLFFDISTNAEFGKFFHPRHGISIPFYFNYSRQVGTPEYDPYNPDIELNSALATLSNNRKDSLLRLVQDLTTRKAFSFMNVRKLKTDNDSPLRPWHIENFSASYAFSSYRHYDYNVANSIQKTYRAALDYNFSNPNVKFIEPFKNIKNRNLAIIRDFSFNLMPSLINFRIDVNRVYNENTMRDNSSDNVLPTYYNKNFNMSRIYGISWDLTKSLRLDFNATNYSIIDEPVGRIDGLKQDTMWTNFWKMGRTTDYNHMMNITYTLPINKIPYLEWVNVVTRYGTQFNWQSEPLLAIQNQDMNIGNSIQNNRTIQINPTLNFSNLYNRFKFFRDNTRSNSTGPKAILAQLLSAVRTINGAYTKNEGQFLPGYLPKTNLLGLDFDHNAPGFGFIFGSQSNILNKALQNSWISMDTLQNQRYTKTYAENISVVANLEPFKGLRIDLSSSRIDNYNYSAATEYNAVTGNIESVTPYTTGNYSITQIAIKSAFKDHNELFRIFEENRVTISARLAERNLNSVGFDNEMFADGYGKAQQDVVINSFLTTYLGKDVNSSSLNKMPKFPLPNWRISYNRLANVLGLTDFITSLAITHAYNSLYSVTGYNSVLRYKENDGMPSERDVNANFLPKFQYDQVSIIDQFVPLIGLDIRFANSISATSELRRMRNMNFTLANSQMSMLTENSFVLGMGYRKSNVGMPFGWFSDKKWSNDVNFKLDVAINDRKTIVYRSDLNSAEISAGNKSISFNPTLDYVINQQYNIQLFYNSNIVKPYTSQNYATSYTNFGVNIRIFFQ
ncbi:cell surface protein SprA [Sphingobacterium psychroaquaticum]|uniref:T9SS outer membrane translocon Sov/SprA n=1 Tax=Sphingobacterium psychroaquaticum TaxID=561061 RepID=UPI00106953AD|nr:cell surface protein SprA [Sphingobacterium psychroaquaticum]QBQ40071.1 cell surface protein SprA [Sphingobacterium psychroaquaticum]